MYLTHNGQLTPAWRRNYGHNTIQREIRSREITSLNCSLGSIQATRPGTTRQHDDGAAEWGLYRVVTEYRVVIVLCMPVCTWMNLARLSGKKPNMNHRARQNTGQNVSLQTPKHWARGIMTNQHGKWQVAAYCNPLTLIHSIYNSSRQVRPENRKRNGMMPGDR